MNAEATEILQNCSPLQRTRTHRYVYVNNAIDDDQVLVPELVYESKYTPNTITALLQHAEARKDYAIGKVLGQNRRSPQSRQVSVMRKSDYISPISMRSAPPHQRPPLPNIGRSSAKPTTSTNVHVSKTASTRMREGPNPAITSMPQSAEAGHIVQLEFAPSDINKFQVQSSVRISPGSPTMKVFKHFVESSPSSTVKSRSKDQTQYRAGHESQSSAGHMCTPAPSRVQSRLQPTNSTPSPAIDINLPEKHKDSMRLPDIDIGFSVKSVVNDLLALPTPQIHCTSPSLRMRFLNNNQ